MIKIEDFKDLPVTVNNEIILVTLRDIEYKDFDITCLVDYPYDKEHLKEEILKEVERIFLDGIHELLKTHEGP